MDLPKDWEDRKLEDNWVKLQITQEFLPKISLRTMDGGDNDYNVYEYQVDNYVTLQCPFRPPNK